MATYKCFASDFENLTKRINRITKKLDKHNLKWSFEKLEEYVERVAVYAIDEINKCKVKVEPVAVNVITYEFEMESLKLGEYTPIAVLDHTVSETENIIHNLTTESEKPVEIPEKYRTVKSICEHCKSNRQRNKTVLLQDAENNIKQVGTDCIKEYTGIDASDIISIYADIHELLIQDLEADYERISHFPRYTETIDYLTACIQLITEKGYVKESYRDNRATKIEAWEIAGSDRVNSKYKTIAEKVIEYFKNNTFTNDFLNNIKVYLNNKYTKESGFIAYAYIAYQKQKEIENKLKAEKEKGQKSSYVGNIGDKIELTLTIDRRITTEYVYSAYNSTTNYIYIMHDDKNNIFTWKTSTCIFNNQNNPADTNDIIKLKGTIKAHNEYKETKQTELTRCKVI
jgi:hypothetical protein